MKLLIIDDHPTLRAGLAALLQQVETGTEILETSDGAEGIKLAREHPDLDAVFVDLYMPGVDGMSAIQEFARRHPQLPIIVLSASENPQDVRRALALGALGYLPKSASPQTILSAFRLVLAGEVYVPPLMLDAMPLAGPVSQLANESGAANSSHLTERQQEVLALLCKGMSNKAIARELDLSEKTVKAHVSSIFRTLNVTNRTQATNAARQAGIVPKRSATREDA